MKKKKARGIRKKLGCKFIRINTSNAKKDYDTDYDVSKIQIFISEFKDKKIKQKENTIKEKDNTRKGLEDELKKMKLQLTNQSVLVFKKCFAKLQKMKKTQLKIKPIKFGKELGTTYCLGCKDFTHNFRPQK